MADKVYTEEEMQKILTAAREKDLWMAFGKQWFIECLAHTENLVRQGAFPQESHRVGQILFQQFNMRTTEPAPAKKEEEPASDQ